jgi:hypothetical protein
MPHDYNAKTNQFTTARGRRIPVAEVRAAVDELVALVGERAADLGERYAAGKISIYDFHIEMRELLKAAHVVAASVGKGGYRRMTQADWGRVGAKLKSEYGYLAKLVRKIERGTLAKAHSAYRARKYAAGVVMSYHRTMRKERMRTPPDENRPQVRLVTHSKEGCSECAADESRGWVDPADMSELGTRICGNYCLCDLVFSDDVEAGRISITGEVAV